MASITQRSPSPVEHAGETVSNDVRNRSVACEPEALRTYTPSLAVLDRSAGSYHWTPEGRRLADFTSGVLVANLGHNPTRWWQALLEYLGVGQLDPASEFTAAAPLTAYNAVTDLEVRASERLLRNLQQAPGGQRLGQVCWAASGSEAVQKALWSAMARRPGEDIILATRYGFHGKKGLAGAVTGSEQDHERDRRVRFVSFPRDECCDLARRSEPLDLAPYRAELDQLAAEFGSRICCLITEPYLGGGGSYHPQPEYLQLLQEFCRTHDALFILDEVQSNFGRTGPMYAFTHYGIEPDIVCLGKGLGNGVPVSAAVGPVSVFSSMEYGEFSDTWSANPLASAAVLATLDEFEHESVLESGLQVSAELEAGLRRLQDTPLVEHIRGEGCVWGIECKPCGKLSANEVANACVEACYLGDDRGRAVHLLGPLAGKVIRISPPLVMPTDEVREYFDVMYSLFSTLAENLTSQS